MLIGWNVSRPTTSSTVAVATPTRVESIEQLAGEVQSGRRRSCRARLVGEHRLVAIGIVQPLTDVRRQRHLAVSIEQRQRIVVAEQLDLERVAGCGALPHPHDVDAVGATAPRRADLAAGPHERLPGATCVVERLEQEHLGRTTGRPLQPEPGRNHPRLVDDHQVAGPQDLVEIRDAPMLDRLRPRGRRADAAASRGSIGTCAIRSGGKSIVEVGDAHASARSGVEEACVGGLGQP